MNPKFPIYIVSKGRYESRLTAKALDRMNIPYHIVIESEEYDKYASVITKEKILILDKRYQDEYDTCDNLGNSKSKGPGAARNFCWEHSIKNGYEWHWVMDDNISYFFIYNNNRKIYCYSGNIFTAMEDFVLRYTNIAMAGPAYYMFIPEKEKNPPFIMNTRIYSCNLIRNDLPYRWRGRYNEDTDLSLRILKDGWCTVEFTMFLQRKAPTQTVKGGCMEDFYSKEGTLPKSRMQVKLHPDVSKLVWKFGRWHHSVDYSKFKKNKLIRRDDIDWDKLPKTNNYNLKLIKIKDIINATS